MEETTPCCPLGLRSVPQPYDSSSHMKLRVASLLQQLATGPSSSVVQEVTDYSLAERYRLTGNSCQWRLLLRKHGAKSNERELVPRPLCWATASRAVARYPFTSRCPGSDVITHVVWQRHIYPRCITRWDEMFTDHISNKIKNHYFHGTAVWLISRLTDSFYCKASHTARKMKPLK